MEVFVLQHTHGFDDGSEETKFIGVYSTRQDAEAAIRRLSTQPGFCNLPDGFCIDDYTLDKDHWCEGFFTDGGATEMPHNESDRNA